MATDRSVDLSPLQRLAAADLVRAGHVHPTLVGYADGRAVCAVELRTHPAGGYDRPMIEALALLLPLGCDALAFLGSGRVWSTDDPIPPVTEDVDLRQRVALTVLVEATGTGDTEVSAQLLPYDIDPVRHRAEWGAAVELEQDGAGRLVDLLTVPLARRDRLDDDPVSTGRQALRLVRLGHRVIPLAGGQERLWHCVRAALDGTETEKPAARG